MYKQFWHTHLHNRTHVIFLKTIILNAVTEILLLYVHGTMIDDVKVKVIIGYLYNIL